MKSRNSTIGDHSIKEFSFLYNIEPKIVSTIVFIPSLVAKLSLRTSILSTDIYRNTMDVKLKKKRPEGEKHTYTPNIAKSFLLHAHINLVSYNSRCQQSLLECHIEYGVGNKKIVKMKGG